MNCLLSNAEYYFEDFKWIFKLKASSSRSLSLLFVHSNAIQTVNYLVNKLNIIQLVKVSPVEHFSVWLCMVNEAWSCNPCAFSTMQDRVVDNESFGRLAIQTTKLIRPLLLPIHNYIVHVSMLLLKNMCR